MNFTIRDDVGGYRVREGLSKRIRSIRIAERRIRGKVRTKEIGFISRRTSHRAIRANKIRKAGVTEDVEDFICLRTRNIFQ